MGYHLFTRVEGPGVRTSGGSSGKEKFIRTLRIRWVEVNPSLIGVWGSCRMSLSDLYNPYRYRRVGGESAQW